MEPPPQGPPETRTGLRERNSEAVEGQGSQYHAQNAASNIAFALLPLVFIILLAVVVSDDEPSEVFDQNEACGWWQDQFFNEDRWQWDWSEEDPEQHNAGEA